MVEERVTRHPTVDASENGDGATRVSREWFDERGNRTYRQDELGHVRKQVFETKRERLIQTVVDADEVPVGSNWTLPDGPFLELTTDTEYDDRGRIVGETHPENLGFRFVLDNHGRTLQTDRLSGREDGLLVARTEEFFDKRGRSYRRRIHAVNPTNGAVTGSLDENLWHDARGDLVRKIGAGDGQKAMDYRYDGARRRIETATVALESHRENEVVVESVRSVLNPAGLEEQRIHSALDSFASPQSPSYRVSYTQSWWDGIWRPLARSSLGALSTAPTRPAVPPASDANTLVSRSIYNSRGLMEDSITPAGKIERTEYDDRNRVARTIRNFIAPGDPGQPGADANQTVTFAYTPNDQMAGFTVRFADPAKNQTTDTPLWDDPRAFGSREQLPPP